jgi:hypothetical protein
MAGSGCQGGKWAVGFAANKTQTSAGVEFVCHHFALSCH